MTIYPEDTLTSILQPPTAPDPWDCHPTAFAEILFAMEGIIGLFPRFALGDLSIAGGDTPIHSPCFDQTKDGNQRQQGEDVGFIAVEVPGEQQPARHRHDDIRDASPLQPAVCLTPLHKGLFRHVRRRWSGLIHEFHDTTVHDGKDLPTRAVRVNLIEGRLAEVVIFLDELSSGIADANLKESHRSWRDEANFERAWLKKASQTDP